MHALGHAGACISQTSSNKILHLLAESQKESGTLIPKTCHAEIPTVVAWDNADWAEDTLTGKGTTHITNGIIIQPAVQGCALPPGMQIRRCFGEATLSHEIIFSTEAKSMAVPATPYSKDLAEYRTKQDDLKYAKKMDLLWVMMRNSGKDDEDQCIPGWTAFNGEAKKADTRRKHTVTYLPAINAPPTTNSTVIKILQRSVQISDELKLKAITVVFDQAIYQRAVDIMMQNSALSTRLVIRMGSFHMSLNYLRVIGQRFGSAGFSEVLVEAGVIGPGSVSGVLEGKHYNRAKDCHKIMVEAMRRLQLEAFSNWLEEIDRSESVRRLAAEIRHVREKCLSNDNIEELFTDEDFGQVYTLYQEFSAINTGPTGEYWSSYLEMADLFFAYTRATRENDPSMWDLHLACLKDMLVWFHAYDHTKYARYASLYLCDMMALPTTHPDVHQHMVDGGFSVQRSEGSSFASVPIDQTIEQTINKDSKSAGGCSRFSTKEKSRGVWTMTAIHRSEIARNLFSMLDVEEVDGGLHKEAGKTRILRDELLVQSVMEIIRKVGNPFEPSTELISLHTGVVAPKEVEDDLLKAKDIGTRCKEEFLKSRLLEKTVPFNTAMKKCNLKTFDFVTQSLKTKLDGQVLEIKSDLEVMARLIAIAENRKVDLREVFRYELGPLPRALAKKDGTLTTSAKSEIVKVIDGYIKPLEGAPMEACWVVDGMAVLHSITEVPKTYADLAMKVLKCITKHTSDNCRVDFVTDTYPDNSIKSSTHHQRKKDGEYEVRIKSKFQTIPKDFNRFLANEKNKTSLVEFLAEEWVGDEYGAVIGNRQIFVSVGNKCLKIMAGMRSSSVVQELCSTQEEADTKLLLHASHAAQNGYEYVVIKASDTDVLLLALHHQANIQATLIIERGSGDTLKYIDIHATADKLGQRVCKALLGLHSFTGCDTTSAFYGQGKKSQLKNLMKNPPDIQDTMEQLGNNFNPTESLLTSCEKYVCAMYGKPNIESVDELRYIMYCEKPNLIHMLPPTSDSLKQHIMRANYQTAIWKQALVCEPSLPGPDGHGWHKTNGSLKIV